jgi:hypothetical protein
MSVTSATGVNSAVPVWSFDITRLIVVPPTMNANASLEPPSVMSQDW